MSGRIIGRCLACGMPLTFQSELKSGLCYAHQELVVELKHKAAEPKTWWQRVLSRLVLR